MGQKGEKRKDEKRSINGYVRNDTLTNKKVNK